LGKARNGGVQRMPGPDLLRLIHPQDDLVRVEVRDEVRARREQEGNQQALRPAQHLTNEQQQGAQRPEEQRRLEGVLHGCETRPLTVADWIVTARATLIRVPAATAGPGTAARRSHRARLHL
jgi:hypothetical protein